jgi:ATP-dependent Lon protease
MSKALFILSYNDPDAVDKILLDRIHRIKFANLSLSEKIVICNEHILPETMKKMGLEGMIVFEDSVIEYIIEHYTNEPGVRKLKELLFEIVSEINMQILSDPTGNGVNYPIYVKKDELQSKYFKDRREVTQKKVGSEGRVGTINGLWARASGSGGVIPIQTKFFKSDKLMDMKLTGMQGDVMKESMNVAMTVAWEMTPIEIQDTIVKRGVHVHCPDGAVPKDGPSAGAAITVAIYSLLNNRKVKPNVAITGEISLDGSVSEIGGLDAKIRGGVKAGVTAFIYPKDNEKDLVKFREDKSNAECVEGIQFTQVDHIEQVIGLVLEDEN